jgi:hypothetical protein
MGARPPGAGAVRWAAPPGAAHGLSGIRPACHRTDRTRAASRTRTPRPGDNLALPACGRGAPGLTGRPVHSRGDHGGRTRRPEALQSPPTAHACCGVDAVSLCQGAASAARQQDPDGPDPGASCARRRRLGVPAASARQSAPAPAPGTAPRSAPGHQVASARPARHTGAPVDGHRHTCHAGRCGHGPGMPCLHGGHGPAGGRAAERLKMTGCGRTRVRGCHPLSAEAQPRCGVTLGSVKRPTGPLVPRVRPAPDGGKEGGNHPTASSVSTRRVFLAPALPREKRETLRQT